MPSHCYQYTLLFVYLNFPFFSYTMWLAGLSSLTRD